MKQVHVSSACLILLLCSVFSHAQQTVATNTNVVVPPLVNFSGTLTDANGKPMTGTVAVTFSLYSEQTGGAALWMETQNVQPDSRGHYTVMLGSTSSTGLPSDIFVAGEAHWLGVQVQGQSEEQPRVLLVSAPYALKAGDAQTLGGLPASAFVLAAPPTSTATSASSDSASATPSGSVTPSTTSDVTTSGGTVDAIPLFSTATNIQNSLLSQTGTTAINVGGKLNLPTTGTATATAGKNSQPQDFVASVFNKTTGTAVPQTFQFQAEPAGNDTTTASGTLNLLYASGTNTPAETGLKISSKGLIAFAAGQTFPGTGDGTITGVTAGTDLTGGGTSGKVTLNLNTAALNAVYPQLAASNTFTGTQTINNTTTITGTNGNGVLQVTNTGTSAGNPAIVATTNSTDASAVKGVASATSGTSNGVYGVAENSSGASNGVYGVSNSSSGYGVQGSSPYVGVYGNSSRVGVYGQADGASGALPLPSVAAGVWGDTGGTSDEFSGVLGTAGDNNAGAFVNDSGSDRSSGGATLQAANGSSDASALVFVANNSNSSSWCDISTGGDLFCTGTVSGAVRAGGDARRVVVHAMQSPENWFEDFGSGTLANGAATVALDPTFASTVNTTTDYHVFLTPNGDCKGLYVSQKSADSFEVRELGGGQSSVAFDYRIVAKRLGYENQRLEDVTERYQKMQEDQRLRRERMQQRRAAGSAAEPVALGTTSLHK
jgi:hypothetical protein